MQIREAACNTSGLS